MARHDHREPNPQEAQRDGQGAISQNNPLRELHQEGEAANDRPIGSTPATTPELTDEEVSVLCDIEREGSTHPTQTTGVAALKGTGFCGFFRGAAVEGQADVACSTTLKQAWRRTE
jgi:hypothetical protein